MNVYLLYCSTEVFENLIGVFASLRGAATYVAMRTAPARTFREIRSIADVDVEAWQQQSGDNHWYSLPWVEQGAQWHIWREELR